MSALEACLSDRERKLAGPARGQRAQATLQGKGRIQVLDIEITVGMERELRATGRARVIALHVTAAARAQQLDGSERPAPSPEPHLTTPQLPACALPESASGILALDCARQEP